MSEKPFYVANIIIFKTRIRRNNHGKTVFTLTKWNSPLYNEALTLRNNELKLSSGKQLLFQAPREEKNDLHLVVKRGNRVVGTLLLHPISNECAQFKQVAVDTHFQGEGLGKIY